MELIPVFVPSYKRPRATFLKRSFLYDFPLYVFVREEEIDSYRYLKERSDTHLIKIRGVSNIGETRRVMVKYATFQGIDKIIMVDDDVSRLDLSVWDEEKKIVKASGTVKGKPEDWGNVLRRWESLWKDEALFGASYRPFSWSTKKEDMSASVLSQLQQCVGVNVKLLSDAGLNYQSNSVVGNEDLFLQLQCYEHGLKAVMSRAIQYDCAAMGSGEGGCNASEAGSLAEKQETRVKAFLNACDNLDLVKVGQTRSGVKSIKFNWKEIKKIYEHMEGDL